MHWGAKSVLLGTILCGLCLSASANTTIDEKTAANAAPKVSANLPGIEAPVPTVILQPPAVAGKPLQFTLLLPLQSTSLGNAANAVRAGFLAAYEREKSGIAVNVVDSGDTAEEVVSSYTNALAASDILIGPLTRGSAAAIAQSGAVRKPTISLTQTDVDSAASSQLPPLMLAMGLSVEDEARQVAGWIASLKPAGKVYVVSTSTSWQRRAAKAFAARGQALGLETVVVELGSTSGFLSAADVAQFEKQQAEKTAAVFVALDDEQTTQVRAAIGASTPIYGTAQLNPLALVDWAGAKRTPELNGVHLVDIPWQLQADHPAVMIYPHLEVAADQKRSVDLERLYALGIDAFRVARQVATQRKQFELDGVTGKLTVSFGKDRARFERIEPVAIYRNGAVTPLTSEPAAIAPPPVTKPLDH